MFRTAVRAFIPVLLSASAVSAGIVDPVFVRGTKNLANGWFEHLEAFESASDMVKYQNSFWTQPMANPNYDKSAFFDGTNYYWVDHRNYDSFYLHDYGSDLNDLINDSGADTHIFHRTSPSHDGSGWEGTWFADSEGGIYNHFHPYINSLTDHATYVYRMRRYATIADVLSDNGTTYDSVYYAPGDRFFAVNGKYYRTNTGGDNVIGIDEYNSFDDLRNGTFSVRYNGGAGASRDLFMVVPRAALGLTGSPSPVPEIDPAGFVNVLALVTGGLGLLERRRKRACRTSADACRRWVALARNACGIPVTNGLQPSF